MKIEKELNFHFALIRDLEIKFDRISCGVLQFLTVKALKKFNDILS
jgi:hypothetical protein